VAWKPEVQRLLTTKAPLSPVPCLKTDKNEEEGGGGGGGKARKNGAKKHQKPQKPHEISSKAEKRNKSPR